MKLKSGLEINDELKGIDSIWEVYRNSKVRLFTVEVNMKLKNVEPAWCVSSVGEKDTDARLIWLDPTWTPKKSKRIKETSINFGPDLLGYTPITQMSRYTLFVSFFRKGLLTKAIEGQKPLYYR